MTAATHVRRRAGREPALTAAAALGALVVLAYFLLLARRGGHVISAVYSDGDAASGPVVGEAAARLADHGQILLGNIAWYPQLWFYELTEWLPASRQLWEVFPLLVALTGVAGLTAVVWRLWDRWSALAALLICVCVGPELLGNYLKPVQHQTTYFGCCLLAVALVAGLLWFPRRPRLAAALWIVAGLVTGVLLAADALLVVAGLLPLVVAAAMLAFARATPAARRTATWSIAAVALAVIVSKVVSQAMTDAGVVGLPLVTHFAAFDQLVPHFWLMVHGLLFQDGAEIFGQQLTFTSGWGLVAGLLVLVVAALPFVAVRGALRAGMPETPLELARVAWVAYWAACSALLAVSWILTDRAIDVYTARYLVPLFFAGAATAPLVLHGARGRTVLVLAAAVIGFNGALALGQDRVPSVSGMPTPATANQVTQIARAHGLRIGYAHYWNAAAMTWMSHFKVRLAPVEPCGDSLCPTALHHVAAWYRPRPATRTFLVVDPGESGLAAAPAKFGRPFGSWQAGSATIYGYPYDIASRFG